MLHSFLRSPLSLYSFSGAFFFSYQMGMFHDILTCKNTRNLELVLTIIVSTLSIVGAFTILLSNLLLPKKQRKVRLIRLQSSRVPLQVYNYNNITNINTSPPPSPLSPKTKLRVLLSYLSVCDLCTSVAYLLSPLIIDDEVVLNTFGCEVSSFRVYVLVSF